MSLTVFSVVIAAALLHAAWNALIKGGGDRTVNMTALVLGHLPFAFAVLPFVPVPDYRSWPFIAASVVLHIGYQYFLNASYRVGDLTHVYPIARGSAPLLVAGVSVVFLGVHLSPLELLAIAVIGAGILSLALVRQGDGARNMGAASLSIATGCFIAGYSLVDGTGARLAGTAVGYLAWMSIINAAIFAGLTAVISPGALSKVATRGRRAFFIGGTASFTAYAMVTWAFTQAPIALVTALRETSIVFALFIGVFFLKEKLNLAKVFSTMVTLLGAALLRYSKQ